MENTILISDNDTKALILLTEYFQGAGFSVVPCSCEHEILNVFHGRKPTVVVLSVRRSGSVEEDCANSAAHDNLEVLQAIRAVSEVPLMVLTEAGDAESRIAGLEMGADDCLEKPLNLRELLARVRAVLRRYEVARPGANPLLVECAGLTLNTGKHELIIGNTVAVLSPTETKLIATLMRQPNMEFSRDDLMHRVWGRDLAANERCVDVHIAKLRTILKPYVAHAQRIRTVWGKGYVFLDA